MVATKVANTDFGIWFEMNRDGSKNYDFRSASQRKGESLNAPLLIAVPYSAANTPKPQGSQFDNVEVVAIATLRYYQDPTTTIEDNPHLRFLIDAIREGEVSHFFETSDSHWWRRRDICSAGRRALFRRESLDFGVMSNGK